MLETSETLNDGDARTAGKKATRGPERRSYPDVDAVAARVHAAWVDVQRASGYHSRLSETSGDERMVSYADLSDHLKKEIRLTVQTVYAVLTEGT